MVIALFFMIVRALLPPTFETIVCCNRPLYCHCSSTISWSIPYLLGPKCLYIWVIARRLLFLPYDPRLWLNPLMVSFPYFSQLWIIYHISLTRSSSTLKQLYASSWVMFLFSRPLVLYRNRYLSCLVPWLTNSILSWADYNRSPLLKFPFTLT